MADLPETLPLEMDTRASEELMEFAHKEVTRERYLGQKLEDNSIAFFVVAMICGAEQDPKSTRQEVTKEVIELFSSSLGDEAAGRLAEAFVLSVWEEGARICRRHGLLKGPEPIRAPPGGRVSSAVVAPATDEEEKRRLARASRFGNVASAAIRGAADDARHRTDGPLETGGRRGRNRGASPGNGFRGASPGGRKVRAEAGGVGGRLIGGAVKAALAGGGGGGGSGGGGSGGGGGRRRPVRERLVQEEPDHGDDEEMHDDGRRSHRSRRTRRHRSRSPSEESGELEIDPEKVQHFMQRQMEFHGRMMGPRPGFAPGMGGPMGAPPRGFMPQMGGPRPMIHGRPGMMPPPMGGGAPFIGGPRGPMGFDGGRGGRGGGRGRGGRGGFGSQRKGIAFRPPPDDEGPLSEEEKRARTVFVSKLHRACTSAAVKDFFGQVGYVVNVSMMIDFATGQSRGMAHVRMANKEGAEAALALNGTLFAGREVAVAPFKDKKEREPPADKAAAKEAPAAREAQGGAEGGKPKVRKWVRPGSGLPGDPLLEEKKEEGEIVAEAVAKAAAQQN